MFPSAPRPEDTVLIHIVLLGDSIFDNAAYVDGRPSVIEQLREELGASNQATLLAVDGDSTRNVLDQLARLPNDSTHLFVSAGGNDALDRSSALTMRVATVAEALNALARVTADFSHDYEQMLQSVRAVGKPTTVCTVYDSIPGLDEMARCALAIFNDVILRAAFGAGLPVIDLRLLCDEVADYSEVSPIEPSSHGGAKIASAIAHVVKSHDYGIRRTVIYGGWDR